MKERPILFSAPMVRALLAGTKTQTRRMVKPQPTHGMDGEWIPDGSGPGSGSGSQWPILVYKDREINPWFDNPYGKPGDRLWVKETFWGDFATKAFRWYVTELTEDMRHHGAKKIPSLFMPKKFSRILLEVTAVRVERLQDISEEDARAEGFAPHGQGGQEWSPRGWYECLWESINGPGSWEANPWVWVVEFRRVL